MDRADTGAHPAEAHADQPLADRAPPASAIRWVLLIRNDLIAIGPPRRACA
ncbi:MAG TPA: hypothetical protein VHT91_06870 [Kofleriaceae bacterium]|jgi:hypothetical protein|nr:hypothetical protein [Kofleriaceae bacterium]